MVIGRKKEEMEYGRECQGKRERQVEGKQGQEIDSDQCGSEKGKRVVMGGGEKIEVIFKAPHKPHKTQKYPKSTNVYEKHIYYEFLFLQTPL